MENIFWIIIAIIPISLFVFLFGIMTRMDIQEEFSITDYIGRFFQQEFNKAQGWKGANDF